MVKFLMSFLLSFKSFPDNDTQFHHETTIRKGSIEQPHFRFRTHPDRKNICNITYSLPGPKETIEKKISVACWTPMLKVYGKREDHVFRTEWSGDKTWAAFSVRQTLDDIINPDQVKTIFARSLEFHFNEDQKYVQRFRNDQWATYVCPKISNENYFGPVYSFRERSKSKQKSTVTISSNMKKKLTIKTETSKSKTPEPEISRTVAKVHLHKIIKAMCKSNEEGLNLRTPSNCTMLLPVSNLFYDKSVWVLRNDRPMSKNVQDIFVFVTVYSFLDEEIRKTLNPFSINVESLQYLPVKELQAEGINRLFVEYELEPVIPTTRTKLQYLRQNCVNQFQDIKVFLTERFSPLTIISGFQSKKLFVRVIGVKDNLPQPKYNKTFVVYGADMNDDRFSSCIKLPITNEFQKPRTVVKHKSAPSRSNKSHSTSLRGGKKTRKRDDQLHILHNKDNLVLIGMARIDLSSLVFGNSSVTIYEELSSLPVMIDNPQTADIEHLTITNVHTDLCKYENGALQNRLLYENNAMVKLTAKCGFLITPASVSTEPSINNFAFSRVITILLDKDFATEILQKIFIHNRESLDMRDYDLPLVPFRKMYKVNPPPLFKSILTFQPDHPYSRIKETSSKDLLTDIINPESYFTGFSIDCINKVLMYLEGPTISTFPTLLTELVKFNINQGRILYSSDLIYDNRIYNAFKHLGGVYCITMISTVDDLLKKGSSLCHGVSVPEPAWKALKTISKLLDSKTVLEAVQDHYLPFPEQLISFDIEFGIPHCIVK